MLEAFFRGQSVLVVATLISCALVAGLTRFVCRHRLQRPGFTAAFAASVVGVLFLTFSGSSGEASHACVVNREVVHGVTATQGVLNVALFVPVGFLAMWALRLPLLAVAGPAVLSLSIEVVQATVPPLARACDSSDFFANSLGGAIGMAAAWLVLRSRGGQMGSFKDRLRPIGWACAGVVVVCVLVGATSITLNFRDGDTIRAGDDDMRAAVETRLTEAFGDHYTIENLEYDPTGKTVYAFLNGGTVHLSWPDRRNFAVSLIGWQEGIDPSDLGSYPLSPPAGRPDSAEQAERVARTYLEERYPGLLTDTDFETAKVADGRLGWVTSVRRERDGVLMPMRLDVSVDARGRISDLLVRDIADPSNLPEQRVTEAQAKEVAKAHPDLPQRATEIGEGELIAAPADEAAWRLVWLFPTGVAGQAGPIVAVDAETGRPTTYTVDGS
ncbi:VanZ family protein [Streptomyces chumphonensis]|uniref:VanZ family protein n=1 Tax=Streptomyces chumphonensis TaxID=1214925 RepID=UPI003D71A5D4